MSATSVKGHIFAIGLIYSLPIAFLIKSTFNSFLSKNEVVDSTSKIYFYSIVTLTNIVLVVGIFTASVVNTSGYETIGRLHMRYYNFLLPLLYIIAASQLSLRSNVHTFKLRAIAAFLVGTVILYVLYSRLIPYSPNFVDSPELRGFVFNRATLYFLGGLSFLSLLLWVFAPRKGAFVYVFIFMPLAVACSSIVANHELRNRVNEDIYDKAGIFTKHYLSNEELSKLVIVGHEYGFLFRSLFHIDNSQVTLVGIPEGSTYNLKEIPPGKDWVLVIGDSLLWDEGSFQVLMPGFKLVRRH
jgi:phosphoglycerol transferase